MANNKDLAKTITDLTKSIQSMQDNLMMLKKRGPTQSGIDDICRHHLARNTAVQLPAIAPPPNKKLKVDNDDEHATDDELDDPQDDSTLFTIFEEAVTFLEAALNNTLDNERKGQGSKYTQLLMDR